MRDVTHALARAAQIHARVQSLLGGAEQVLRERGHLSYREGAGGVRYPAVEGHADVHGQDIPALEAIAAGDPVHDHRVGRCADRAGESAVTLERGDCSLGADEALDGGVKLLSAHTGTNLAGHEVERRGLDQTGGGHLLDLLGRLLNDHPRSLSFQSSPSLVPVLGAYLKVESRTG